MNFRPVLPPLTLALSLISGAAVSQNQHAVDNASENASFKRCATEHPSQAEAKKLEKEMRKKLAAVNAKGKPDKPGGGGNGGGGMVVAVMAAAEMAAVAVSYLRHLALKVKPASASSFTLSAMGAAMEMFPKLRLPPKWT